MSLGFHKNDYKIIIDDEDIEDDNFEDSMEMNYSDIIEQEDLALDILFFLQDSADKQNIPLFDKCNLTNMIDFLSYYDSSFKEN